MPSSLSSRRPACCTLEGVTYGTRPVSALGAGQPQSVHFRQDCPIECHRSRVLQPPRWGLGGRVAASFGEGVLCVLHRGADTTRLHADRVGTLWMRQCTHGGRQRCSDLLNLGYMSGTSFAFPLLLSHVGNTVSCRSRVGRPIVFFCGPHSCRVREAVLQCHQRGY